MGHQLPHGHRLAVVRRHLEVEVLIDVGVEIDLARGDQLHDRRPGEQLRNGARAEQGLVGIDRPPGLDVRKTVAPFEQRLPVLDDDDDDAGDVGPLHLGWDHAVEIGGDILGRERMGAGRRGSPRAAVEGAPDARRRRKPQQAGPGTSRPASANFDSELILQAPWNSAKPDAKPPARGRGVGANRDRPGARFGRLGLELAAHCPDCLLSPLSRGPPTRSARSVHTISLFASCFRFRYIPAPWETLEACSIGSSHGCARAGWTSRPGA